MKNWRNFWVVCLGALVLAWPACGAAFIKFDGIDGESTDHEHRGWSQLVSFSHTMLRPQAVPGGGAGRRAGRVLVEDILVVKELDKSSPKLAEALLRGQVIPRVQIHLTRQVGEAQTTYFAYELKNVQITSYSVSGSAQSDQVPTDSISFNFEEIKVTYTEFDATGRAAGKVEYTWKVEEGTK